MTVHEDRIIKDLLLMDLETPPCFDNEEQYREWATHAVASEHNINNYCVDCTQEYQAKMMKAGRCEHPDFKEFGCDD